MDMTASPTPVRSASSLEALFADEAAFRVWYDKALPTVYRYLFHRCGRDPDLAEELTQQTFVEAVRSRARFTDGEPVAWLIGIARHRLIDHFRVLERREKGLRRLLTASPRVGWIGQSEVDDELAAALAGLPAAQRAAIVLRYLDDLAVRDVARLLGRSEGAVESLLSRGRAALRRSYTEDMG
jgi:RNA polymerase sigma-70 factor (ECF subfamily)